MNSVVVAVIGCGRIARDAHLPALTAMPDVRVKYVCDIVLSKAQALKNDFPTVEQVIADYRTALQDEEVNVVYVLTPNGGHYPITMDALRAGKHVFCEKPVALNYELALEMANEASKQGKMLNIGVCNRYHRSVELLEQMNREGRFGKLYHVYCSFRSFRSIPGLGGAFTTKRESGGGVLIDWGIHFFDLILYVLGGAKLKSLTCDAYAEMAKDMKTYRYTNMWAEDTADVQNGTNDVEDLVAGYIRTDKASISFNGAWAQNIAKNEMFIDFLGDKGGARLTYCGKFELYDGDTLQTVEPEYNIPDMYAKEDEGFIASVKSGVKGKSHIDYVLESTKLIDALYCSAEQRREIQLD